MQPALLLTFDVEEFDLPRERGCPLDRETECDVTEQGLQTLLPLLAQHHMRATFFVTGRFAAARSGAVRALYEAGHEIAAHGLVHADDYASMNPTTAVVRLRRCRALLEQLTGTPPAGIRAPRLRSPAPAVLSAAGFTYDASPHPTWMPRRYNGLRLSRVPWLDGDLIRVPISVVPGIRCPISWVSFRLMGCPINLVAAWMAGYNAPYLHLYFHPWEATDIRRLVPGWLAVRTGAPFLDALDRLLAWTRGRFAARTVAEVAGALAPPGHNTP